MHPVFRLLPGASLLFLSTTEVLVSRTQHSTRSHQFSVCNEERGNFFRVARMRKNLRGAASCQELNMERSRFLRIRSLCSVCVRCEERLRPWPRPQTRASRNHTFSLFRSACLWFGAPQRMRSFDGAASLHAVPGQQLRGPSPRRDVTQRLTTLKASRL